MRSGSLARTLLLLLKHFHFIVFFFRTCRSVDGTVRVWHRSTLEPYRLLKGHEGRVNAIGLQAGRIVSASEDGKMILWDIESGERIRTLSGYWRELVCVDFKVRLLSISLFVSILYGFDGYFCMFRETSSSQTPTATGSKYGPRPLANAFRRCADTPFSSPHCPLIPRWAGSLVRRTIGASESGTCAPASVLECLEMFTTALFSV